MRFLGMCPIVNDDRLVHMIAQQLTNNNHVALEIILVSNLVSIVVSLLS